MDSKKTPWSTFWSTLWESNFHSAFSQTLLICIATYLILIVYSFLCIQLMPNVQTFSESTKPVARVLTTVLSNDATDAIAGKVSCGAIFQFFIDALFPSTLTLMITMVAQNLVACAAKAGIKYSWTLFALVFTIIYALSSFGFRLSLSIIGFIFFLISTGAVVAIGLISVKQVEESEKKVNASSVGISS